jgi:CHAT domain-containing protein
LGAPIGRAEAMRLSMRALMNQDDFAAHRYYWAPFVVVGEGSAQ